ncbi:MAG TPA: hypothetical protein PKD53_18730 [Chloroflexaceae bacterium]|nr:hypothetical protein [Chloroflexaceae bacterium]
MYTVTIEVRGRLDADWSDWMGGLVISHLGSGRARLEGLLPDQPALYAVLSRLAALNLELLAVRCAPCEPQADSPVRLP